ncbi:hypothetical protein SteCoe_32927 [Stentor coeruleus]|uniref:Tubby C-terminal domain-containing protein n=1 Tax=Stentor coeruleus TaxID=5963 RepID=A0A1R2AXT3_9CILI|nr:hypothetical protein SteCoe_32927 [Stentor coeruleus]
MLSRKTQMFLLKVKLLKLKSQLANTKFLAKGKAIEIKITARKHQVSVESLIACLDYLDHQSFFEVDINAKNMLSMLVTANFLKITLLENYCVEFVGNNIESNSIVDISNIAFQVKNMKLMNKAYLYIRILLLYRFGQMELPENIKDSKNIAFNSPYLHNTKTSSKVSLEIFNYKSQESYIERKMFHEITPQYNLMRIDRTRAEESITGSDYPHTFKLIREHDQVQMLYAERWSDSGNFIISKSPNFPFSDDYIGVMTNNFWGHEFSIFDHGVEDKVFKKFPTGFIKARETKMNIKFETNILGESPRSLNVSLLNDETKEMIKFKNLAPKWNERTECYTLNFYGRVSRASAKNFQLVMPDDQETIYLMFGKIGTESFHLDYRSPISMYQAFCIALASLARKRVVA